MRVGKRLLVALSSLALIAGLLVAPVPQAGASHEATYDVSVGSFMFNPETGGGGPPGESMRFLPGRINVHQGDTLRFSTMSFHSATLLPANMGAQNWLDANAASIGDPFHFFAPNPDGGEENILKLNPNAVFPNCDSPCDYDGSEVASSGVFGLFDPEGFSFKLDAPPGDSFWALCLVHNNMRMKVNVVADDQPASEPAALTAAVNATLARDKDNATALHKKLLTKRTKRTVGGKVVWDAHAGFDTNGYSLFAMYPRTLRVKRGQSVRWHTDSLNFEDHTVTFSRGRALQVLNNEPLLCDPDDAVAGDETEPDFSQGFPPECPEGSEFEIIVTATFALPQGNGVVGGYNDFENSGERGVLAGPPMPGTAPYDLRFNRRSALNKKGRPRPFTYICMIHPEMRGRVIVD